MNTDNKIQIDTSLIPEYVKADLAAATLDFIRDVKKNHAKELKVYIDYLSADNK